MRVYQFIAKNRYLHLLAVLTSFFVFYPVIGTFESAFPVLSLIFFISILLTLRALGIQGVAFNIVKVTVLLAFALDVTMGFSLFPGRESLLLSLSAVIYTFFLLFAIIMMITKMFSGSQVTGDTIRGGVSVYFLIGYLWTLFYFIVYLFDKNAFAPQGPAVENNLLYFSFVTLATLGYGDIVPVNKITMMLSTLEALVGQMYVGIFIARLVGLHIIHNNKKSP